MNVYFDGFSNDCSSGGSDGDATGDRDTSDRPDARSAHHRGRLNLLLSDAGWQERSWAEQLPCLLQPLGILSIRVRSGREATEIIRDKPIHIAVVDLRLPLDEAMDEAPPDDQPSARERAAASFPGTEQGGIRILQLLRRLESPPPTVVIRRPVDQQHARAHQRSLNQALREGAFAVFDVPVTVEQLLETMRRILKRYYANCWPNRN